MISTRHLPGSRHHHAHHRPHMCVSNRRVQVRQSSFVAARQKAALVKDVFGDPGPEAPGRHLLRGPVDPFGGVEVHHYRNTIREPDEQFFFDDYEPLTAGMRGGFGNVGWWFDTSALTAEETATQVIAHAETRARTSP